MKLQIELSYLKDLFGKLSKGKSDLNHILNMQKHIIDKIGLGYNKQTNFSKKTKFVSSKGVNPNKVSKKRNMVYSKRNVKTCHYCMKKGHTSYKCYARDSLWYFDNGCSRHMMGDKSKVIDFVSKDGRYEDNNKGK